MGAFEGLNREIKDFIFDNGWNSLSQIQEGAIQLSQKNKNNLILAAPTASGKTEAAFLPAINSIKNWDESLKIVYISPLVALINDQFKRIHELCNYLNVPVTRWHGEASKSQKDKLVKKPRGILLITPESLEAMLALNPMKANSLFKGTEWVLVDEIHNFLGSNRGLQLQSLLGRMEKYTLQKPRYIGMSATLHEKDYELSKDFFPEHRETNVIVDRNKNKLQVTTQYAPENELGISPKGLKSIYEYSLKESMLVFPNARNKVELITAALNKISKNKKSQKNYYAHHASISKKNREQIEKIAKNSNADLFTIICTSTLELGIDIGSVDSVVQYNSTSSVSSLAQRLGRSGRHTKESKLHFIGTNPWSFLQGLATITLYQKGQLDYQNKIIGGHDVLAHQVLSLLLEYNGLKPYKIAEYIKTSSVWKNIKNNEIKILLNFMLNNDFIEFENGEIIFGSASEQFLKSYEFYSHFLTSEDMTVKEGQRRIGEISANTPGLDIEQNIILAGKLWKIKAINVKTKAIQVIPANDGNPPKFEGTSQEVSHIVRQEMENILLNTELVKNYNKETQKELEILVVIPLPEGYFNIHKDGEEECLFSFCGTRINKTLEILFIMNSDDNVNLNELKSSIKTKNIKEKISSLKRNFPTEEQITNFLYKNIKHVMLRSSSLKYINLVPDDLLVKYFMNNMMDIQGTKEYLNNHKCKNIYNSKSDRVVD